MALAQRSTVLRGLSLALGGMLALLGLVAIQSATTSVAYADAPTSLYVAASGDDAPTNPCTAIDAPCLTVSGGVARAQAAIGDGAIDVVVQIADGTYTENVAIGTISSGHSLSLVGAAAATTTIQGLGTASDPASVINITSGTVNITGLSITGGYSVSGGGIYNDTGALTVSSSTVSGNTSVGPNNSDGGGGGIYNNAGTVAVSSSTVSGNTATGPTQWTAGGGGIYNKAGTVTVTGSTVADNTAARGYAGGIFNNAGTLSVSDSTLSSNAGWYVGGIHNRGTLSVSRSTLSGNIATNVYGGGISNFGGTMTIADSTLSGNSAPSSPNSGKGGAIYNRGVATVTNSTLYGNSATFGGGIHSYSGQLALTNSTLSDNSATRNGGGIRWEGGSITVANSVIATSSCDVNSAVVDGGYNVSDSCRFHAPSGTSITGSTTIALSPLAANGSTGPWTMAIDATSSAHHLVPTCTGTDARGLPRPGFGATAKCDAGAYELQAVATAVTADPESQTLAIDSDATFTATASGVPTPTVQWQVGSGSAWSDIADATGTTLTIVGVTHAMSGHQYRAVFTNGVTPDATSAVATLTVPVGSLDHLVLSPSSASFVAGGSQAFTAEGFDAHGNSLGDVTAATTFTGTTGLTCADGSCASNVAGTYTVTGTDGAATGTASLTVTAIPDVPLPTDMPVASGPLIGVPATGSPGGQFTVTASGFAPNAPVTFGIYSVPHVLGQVLANSSGTAVAQLQIPMSFSGTHTIVAAGMSPAMTPMYLAAPVNVTRLARTGVDVDLSGPIVAGVVLLLLGAVLSVAAFCRRLLR